MPQANTTPATDLFGRAVPAMTADEQATHQAVLKDVAATRRGVLTLDMRNPTHRRFVLDRLGGDDYLERYFPSTRNLVESTRLTHEAQNGPQSVTLLEMDEPTVGEWQPMVNVSYLGLEPGGRTVTAQGVATLPGLASTMTTNMTLTETATGFLLGTQTVPVQYNVSTQTIEVTATIPAPIHDIAVTATLTTQYMPAGGTVARQVVSRAAIVGAIAVQTVTVINPNHNTHPTRDYIKVALNRTPGQVGDCDYYYEYGTDGSKPIVGLQVNGSALLVSGFTVNANPGFNGSCILQRRSSVGDGATLAFPEDQIPALCTGAGNVVTWNIGPDWFQGAPWDQGQTIDLDFVLNFNVTPGGTTFVRVTSVPQAVINTPSNIARIDPMQFVWGCVAAGTQVRMADGSLRAIETLRAGERVATGAGHAGGSLRIAEVWKGFEAKPLYRLATASGAQVLVTDEHPVPTAEGVKLARDLAPGMVVTTTRGPETLRAVQAVSHDGPVYNLDLLPDDATCLEDLDDDAITAFEAGGILVGDNRMQGVWSRRARTGGASADPLQTLGADWWLDVTNSQRLAAGLPLIERVGR